MTALLALGAAITGALLTFWLVRHGGLSADVPNARSSHRSVIPRGGGAGFVISTTIWFGIWMIFSGPFSEQGRDVSIILAIAIAHAVLGALEDRIHLSVKLRLVCETGLAIVFCALTLGKAELFSVTGFAIVLWCVWVANLYNFMDGINGIATIEALTLGGLFSAVGALNGNWDLVALMACVCGASMGFLPFNFPRARIFMGDSGSLFLGSLFAMVPIFLDHTDPDFPAWWGMLSLAPFFFDTAITLLRRLWSRENVVIAHRSHFYQELTDVLHSHAKTTAIYGAASLLFCLQVLSFYINREEVVWLPAIASVMLLCVFFAAIHAAWKSRTRNP